MPKRNEMDKSNPEKIRWAPLMPPMILKRLYDADARGIRDEDLCNEVGIYLYARCKTFVLVINHEVECPNCGTIFPVTKKGISDCPQESCHWHTDKKEYDQSVRNYSASPGRATNAYETFYRRYPGARTYGEKIVLIDQLIHSFHVNEKTGHSAKSIASKLFEGNKKEVVRFLDSRSELKPGDKEKWRRTMAGTIDRRIIEEDSNRE